MNDSQLITPASEFQTQTNGAESDSADEIGEPLSLKITRFLRACWLKRAMVIGIVAAGIVVSVLYALSLPNVYTSTTTLMPPDNASPYSDILSAISGAGATNQLQNEALGLSTPSDLLITILYSRNVQDGLINRLDLTHYYKARSIEDARNALVGASKISEDRNSGMITIGATDRNPVFASKIAQGYVEELNRVVSDNSTSAAHRERVFLEERVKDIKTELDNSAEELSKFSTKSGAIDVPNQTRSIVDEGLRLQAELIDGRSQLAALRQTYSEDNLKVRALEAHNAELEQELNKIGGQPQKSAASGGKGQAPYVSVGQLPQLGLTYYDLERKVRVDEELWEALTKQYESAKVQEAEEVPAVRVLDVADVPETRSSPSRRRIAEIGAIVSFVVALIAVLIAMKWEEMGAEEEPKRLITDVIGATLSSRRWYWALPGMGWIHRHVIGSEGST